MCQPVFAAFNSNHFRLDRDTFRIRDLDDLLALPYILLRFVHRGVDHDRIKRQTEGQLNIRRLDAVVKMNGDGHA